MIQMRYHHEGNASREKFRSLSWDGWHIYEVGNLWLLWGGRLRRSSMLKIIWNYRFRSWRDGLERPSNWWCMARAERMLVRIYCHHIQGKVEPLGSTWGSTFISLLWYYYTARLNISKYIMGWQLSLEVCEIVSPDIGTFRLSQIFR